MMRIALGLLTLAAPALAQDAGTPPAPPAAAIYSQCFALEVAAGTEATAAALICLVRLVPTGQKVGE